jgi:hypothetical protein
MGLGIGVGSLAECVAINDTEGIDVFRGAFAQINQVLAEKGLPLHHEPESLLPIHTRARPGSLGYTWLPYFARAIAYARQAPTEFTPVGREDPAADRRLDRERSVAMDSHIICHSDCEGFYVPIDFRHPIYDDRIWGEVLGSSQRALAELVLAAPLLGIPLRKGNGFPAALARELDRSRWRRRMTEAEWNCSDDAGAMLDHLWARYGVSPPCIDVRFGGDLRDAQPQGESTGLDRALHRYYLASCRGIWKLLPQEASRRGVELAEQFLAGTVSGAEISEYNWHVEGAAFCIDYNTVPADIERWVAEVRTLPAAELQSMLHPPDAADIEPRELLKRAAYFADYAMIYPSLRPKGPPPASYRPFLSAAILRQHVLYPGGGCGSLEDV